jgi:hypothetical protein
MAKLTDERRRALRILARHPQGCTEAVLFSVGKPVALMMIDGLTTHAGTEAGQRRRS